MAKENAQAVKKDDRIRNYATILYPESMNPDWLEIIENWHVPVLISPLHEKDVDEKTGEIKKPHYHIMVMFDGKKDYKRQVKPMFDEIGAVGFEPVHSVRYYARYLCHLDCDSEKKYIYDPTSVIEMSGAHYFDIIAIPEDSWKMIMEMEAWIVENGVIYYSDLSMYARINRPDWHRVLIHNSIHLSYVLRSLEYKETKRKEAAEAAKKITR